MREFEAPTQTLGDLDADVAGRLIAAAADVALIVDGEGVIRDLAFGSEDLLREGYYDWLGKPWADTVTVESRPKVEALLRDSRTDSRNSGALRWRHINHPSVDGADLPLSYAAMALPPTATRSQAIGRAVVFGRDLRANAVLQQRLVGAQQAMERDYWRLRHMETRYRSLFHATSDAVLIVDAVSGKLEEANPAAVDLFGADARPGWPMADAFDATGKAAVQAMLARAGATGQAETANVHLLSRGEDVRLAVSSFRQEKTLHLLVRASTGQSVSNETASSGEAAVRKLIEAAPDAFVVTDLDGRILTANRAFIDLAQLTSEGQVRGQSLEQWLGRTGVDLSVLITNLRQRGTVRLFATVMRGEYGVTTEVEISGVAVTTGEQPCLGFTIRDVSRRLVNEPRAGREVPRSVGQMTELVGRVALKDIVRDTTDLIEQLCIEAALELTHDNRASAAEMLGLSRQSLYVKLRRFNIGDPAATADD